MYRRRFSNGRSRGTWWSIPTGVGGGTRISACSASGRTGPTPAHADWFIGEAERAGQLVASGELRSAARAIYRPDLFDAALSG